MSVARLEAVTSPAVLGEFAARVNRLADGPYEAITDCRDRDVRECAQLVAAARLVARANYRMLEEVRRG